MVIKLLMDKTGSKEGMLCIGYCPKLAIDKVFVTPKFRNVNLPPFLLVQTLWHVEIYWRNSHLVLKLSIEAHCYP